MASIDNKVVSISFDNKDFEKNVGQTLKTLATLKASLDFSGAGAGLQDVSDAASKFSLAGIGSAVDGIAGKFTAMGAIAFSVINNITTRAVDMGVQLAKQFTLTPITEGFAEYELKMGSIQTIMAGSGESLETVNAKLEELNRYSDQTIYSFADMTSNIGKFTNAGLDLDTSVASIQGIANVAAISGANAEEASRAMYNFAQSLSAGSVKLIDWKSIENANMATAEFKQELIDSAVAAGTLTMSADGLYETLEGTPVTATKGFNESLTDQWLTTEALNATLGRYSDTTTDIGARATAAASDIKTFSQMMDTLKESAASGWAQSFEIILGDFEEGKALFTEIGESLSGVIGNSATARNTVLQDWKDLGGRTLLIDSIREGIQNITALLAPLRDAFREVFPRKTGEDLYRMTEAFSRFVKMLKPGEKTITSLKAIFTGLFSAVKIVTEVIKGVFSVFKTLFGLFAGGSSGSILAFFAKIGDAVTELRKALVDDGGIAKYFEKINDAIKNFSFAPLVALLGIAGDRFRDLSDRAKEAAGVLGDAAVKGFGAIQVALSGLSKGFDSVKSALAWFFSSDTEDSGLASSKTGDNVSRFSMILSALGGVAMGVVNAFKTLFSGLGKVGSFVADIGSSIKDALSQVWDAIAGAVGNIGGPSMDNVFKILAGGAIAAIAGALVSFAKNGFKIDFGQFDVLDELGDSLHAVTGGLKAMQKDILAAALMKVAIAIGILTLSLIALSFVDGSSLAKSMTAVASGLALLVGALAGLEKVGQGATSPAKIALLAISMTAIAGAMLLLAMAASLMATTDPVALGIGLLGMMGALEMIVRAMDKLTKNTDGMVKAAFSIGILSVSLLLLAAAIRAWMALDPLGMAVGIFAISASLTVISETMGKMPANGMVKAALSIGILSVSLIILAFAIKQMSDIGLVDTATGLITLGVALKIMATFLKAIAGPDVLKAGAAMLLMSIGVGRLAAGIKALGSINLFTLAKGIAALAVILQVLSKSLNASKTSLGGAVALAVTAGAILLLANAIEQIGRLPFMVLIQGLGGVLLAIGAFALITSIISPLIPLIAALGVSLGAVGIAALAFGAGVYFLARGVSILAKVGPEGVVVFLKSLDDLLIALPKIAAAMGVAAFTFVTSFLSGFDELIPLVMDLLSKLLDAIILLGPKLVETALTLLRAFLGGVRSIFPEIVETGWAIIQALLGGVRDNIGELASTAIGIVTNFINAMAEGIPDYVRAMVNLWTTILTTMAYELGIVITTLAPSIGMALIDGILTGLSETGGKVIDFFSEWVGKIIDWVKSLFGIKSPSTEFLSIGVDLILGLLGGITDTIGQVMSFFTGLLGSVLGWIGDALGSLKNKGINLITGLYNGINDTIGKVTTFFTGLLGKVLGWIGNTFKTLFLKGVQLIGGLLSGIKDKWTAIKDWLLGMKDKVLSFIRNPLGMLFEAGKKIFQGLWDGMKNIWDKTTGWMSNLNPANWKGPPKRDKVMLYDAGRLIMQGLQNGMETEFKNVASWLTHVNPADHIDEKKIGKDLNDSMRKVAEMMLDLHEFNPTITPVLDLTEVERDAKALNGLLTSNTLDTSNGLRTALAISAATNANRNDALEAANNGPTEIKYEQNIHAPTALSTNDIYRQTRSLIAITKEEAKIP